MSATINWKYWEPVAAETDEEVKQTVSTTAAALSVPDGANAVRILFEKNAASAGGDTPIVRSYRHGTDPTASEGKPHFNGEERDIFSLGELLNTKFISADGNDHTLYCQFMRTL